jgi:hypothetical protein
MTIAKQKVLNQTKSPAAPFVFDIQVSSLPRCSCPCILTMIIVFEPGYEVMNHYDLSCQLSILYALCIFAYCYIFIFIMI